MNSKVKKSPIRTRRNRKAILGDIKIESLSIPQIEDLDTTAQVIYSNNNLAVQLYFNGTNAKEIKRRTGYTLSKARKLTEKCIRFNPRTSAMNGFWACIPDRRLPDEQHYRTKPINAALAKEGQGLKGALQQLFLNHPKIEKWMTHFIKYRNTEPESPKVSEINYSVVVSTFHTLCKKVGIGDNEWAFNTKKQGANAIREWWNKTKAKFGLETIENEFGIQAKNDANIDIAAVNSTHSPMNYKAFERLEADEHRVDTLSKIGIPNRNGLITWISINRCWLLALRDRKTKVIVASTICFRDKYDSTDIMMLILRAIVPPARKMLSINNPEFRYLADAAFPAELPEFNRNTWMELALDGDASHLSLAEQGRIENIIGCKVVIGIPGRPAERPTIEGLFREFEQELHRLPTTTGSNPQDTARREPELAVNELELSAHLLEELWDVWCRNFNAKPKASLGGISPLQAAKELNLMDKAFVSPLGELGPNNAFKLLPSYPATITRRRGSHGILRVNLKGASYSSPEFALHPRLLATPSTDVMAYVEEDARYIHVVPDAFPDMFFPLKVTNKDLVDFPHSLQWRMLTERFSSHAGDKADAISPSLMLGFLAGLAGSPESIPEEISPHLAGITRFMHFAGNGGLTLVMTKEQINALDNEVNVDIPTSLPQQCSDEKIEGAIENVPKYISGPNNETQGDVDTDEYNPF
jgi:hypothetical protein